MYIVDLQLRIQYQDVTPPLRFHSIHNQFNPNDIDPVRTLDIAAMVHPTENSPQEPGQVNTTIGNAGSKEAIDTKRHARKSTHPPHLSLEDYQ